MPKRKATEAQGEQSVRFHAEVERLAAAGELSPTEADERFQRVLKTAAPTRLRNRPGNPEK
jgi:hypothetical protein